VTVEKADNVMVVPADCVNYSNGDAYVYTYDAATATAKKTPVEDGLIDSDKIQIVSGLSYDDEVITSWSKELYDGAAVNIQGSDDSAETTADSSETTAEETTEVAETAAK
jgi:multidrug efflux pump subunit AcrA (membrane-fusion protein)